jgi:hypothetical protein
MMQLAYHPMYDGIGDPMLLDNVCARQQAVHVGANNTSVETVGKGREAVEKRRALLFVLRWRLWLLLIPSFPSPSHLISLLFLLLTSPDPFLCTRFLLLRLLGLVLGLVLVVIVHSVSCCSCCFGVGTAVCFVKNSHRVPSIFWRSSA